MKTVCLTIKTETVARQGMGQMDASLVDSAGDAEITVHMAQDDALAMHDAGGFATRNDRFALTLESRGFRGEWTS